MCKLFVSISFPEKEVLLRLYWFDMFGDIIVRRTSLSLGGSTHQFHVFQFKSLSHSSIFHFRFPFYLDCSLFPFLFFFSPIIFSLSFRRPMFVFNLLSDLIFPFSFRELDLFESHSSIISLSTKSNSHRSLNISNLIFCN